MSGSATSIVDVCNRALEDIGQSPILSLTDDSKSARLVARRLPQLRDSLLRSHPWNFAIARGSLPALASSPALAGVGLAGVTLGGATPPDMPYYYQMPIDCLRILNAGNVWDSGDCWGWNGADWWGVPGPRAHYQIEGQTIVARHQPPLMVRYVRQVTDPTQWDTLFTDALVASLACAVCMPLANDKSLLSTLEQMFQTRMGMARGISNLENGDHTRMATAILASRY